MGILGDLVGSLIRHATRQGHGNVAQNVVQLPNAKIYLQLQYVDPELNVRNFPPNHPVIVRFEDGGRSQEVPGTTQADGKLTFDARANARAPWHRFTLRFESTAPRRRYIYAEARGAAQSPGFTTDDPGVTSQETDLRFFAPPLQWSLKTSDWSVGQNGFNGNGRYRANTGLVEHTRFRGTLSRTPRDIGTSAQPVQLVLNPHWKYGRFEYFDRYYGPTIGSPPRPGHGKRISVPPIALEGFRNTPNPAANDISDTRSNWTIGDDADDLKQCLPWINQRQDNGSALPRMTGRTMGLRFLTSQDANKHSYVVSRSKTDRAIQHLLANSPPISPIGAERLKAYDLPRVWKSRNFFVRSTPSSPPAAGRFFGSLDAAAIRRADQADAPLIFCLDDIVLTDKNLAPAALAALDRVAVFFHAFANRALTSPPGPILANPRLSNEGVYLPGNDIHERGYPYSDIQIPSPPYITNYPDWTRLILAQGNMFEAFSERTPDVPASTVVGARAAVRWVVATSSPPGTAANIRPGRTDKRFFSIQPLYRQVFISHSDNPTPGPIIHDEWIASYAPADPYFIGRFDIANLRCTDWDGNNEVDTLFRYHRYSFDMTHWMDSPPVAPPPANEREWIRECVDNINKRWNANDSPIYNPGRAWLVPCSPPATPPISDQIVTLVQYLARPVSHFRIAALNCKQTSWMTDSGAGAQFRVNAIRHDPGRPPARDNWNARRWAPPGRGLAVAHETGHAGSLPDDYRGNTPEECVNYKSLHILGNPYLLDVRANGEALMKGNALIRPRYLWHAAEWLHGIPGFNASDWKIEHGRYRNFSLPHYPRADTNPGRSFVSWPVRFNLRQRNPGDTNLFDSFLYLLGEEEYADQILPGSGSPPLGGGAIDGLLIVLLRMKFDFAGITTAAFVEGVRKKLYEKIEARFDGMLNFRICADFQVYGGARRKPSFRRCLLHFVPCFNTDGAVDADSGITSNDLELASPHHMLVEFLDKDVDIGNEFNVTWGNAPLPTIWNPVENFVQSPPPTPSRQRIRWSDTYWGLFTGGNAYRRIRFQDRAADIITESCIRVLGLNPSPNQMVAGSYKSPPCFSHIVRTVMENAASPPTFS